MIKMNDSIGDPKDYRFGDFVMSILCGVVIILGFLLMVIFALSIGD